MNNDGDFLEIDYCTFCGKPEWDWEKCKHCNKDKVLNNEKYSIPIYENGIKTKWNIEGIIGDEKYFKLLEYGNGKDLPAIINTNITTNE